jgi:type I restriction enzyme R subunit
VVSFGDTELERDYLYCRALASLLRGASSVERLDLGSQVELTHLKVEATFSGVPDLTGGSGEVKTYTGDVTGIQHLPDLEPSRRSSIPSMNALASTSPIGINSCSTNTSASG